jgi:(1->4)-alpha-D-glucan 1-alpha-D-glucosylmutase
LERDVVAGTGLKIPRATYRLQLNAGFTFRDAAAIVPYLAALGISHVYCSPYFRARSGSMHGYDVVDHNSFNPEIGTREDFEHFVTTLRAHDMGHILDIVPNHVGIMGSDNAWWSDVLENGEASVHAEYFDIDWTPANPVLAHKVLVPVLGDPYGVVLERGEIQLRFEPPRGSFAVFYHEHRFPLDPRTYPRILDRALAHVSNTELDNLRRAFGELPDRREPTPEQIDERHRNKEADKKRLADLCAQNRSVASAVDAAVRSLAGEQGHPASFDALHELLEGQAYRLAYWRVAADDINYRRFFDVNDLAALRVENESVFEATHKLLLELVHAGKIDGLRVDHPDGLFDPAQYFNRLQSQVAGSATTSFGVAGEPRDLPIYLVVEKITASFEALPATWPVHGETGYHFANVVNRMLVDAATKTRMDRVYRSFIEESLDWPNVAYDAQHLILRRSLASELNVVANRLARIAQTDRRTRDFTLNSLRQALAEVIACFPVYRTYVTETVSAQDRKYIDWAIAAARTRRSATETPLFDFVRSALLMEVETASEHLARRIRLFAMKFQQVTAPVTAKGIEDTALYRFNRLVSLNEVGGEPQAYGASLRAFHADAQHRARCWPHEMLATSTHDTKRSGDVRARINVLSEMTAIWRQTIERWSRLNRSRKREVEGQQAPSRNDEYLLYQTLIGSWPLEFIERYSAAVPGGSEIPRGGSFLPFEVGITAYRERIEAYMLKAVREAKARSSWANPNEAYEEALRQFIRAILEPRDGNLFLTDFIGFQKRVVRFGLYNGLTQTLCKLTAPGVPDLYQGDDLWDFSLVDPDNRRPVDYEIRLGMLSALQREFGDTRDGGDTRDAGGASDATRDAGAARVRALVDNLSDGRGKLYLIWKTLQFRQAHPELFLDAQYLPLRVTGEHASKVCAFARRAGEEFAIVIAPRLYRRLLGEGEAPPVGLEVWRNTAIELPRSLDSGRRLCNVLDDSWPGTVAGSGGTLLVGNLLTDFPLALLSTVRSSTRPFGTR